MKKTFLIPMALLALLTIEFTQAQVNSPIAIKITKDQWSQTDNTLDVYGLGTNPNALPVKFVGFDKNQQFVIESENYTFNPDGTFHVVLSDAKKEIRFVKVVNIPRAAASATTPDIASTPQVAMNASAKTVAVVTPKVLTQAQIDKIIGQRSPTQVKAAGYFGLSFVGLLIIGLGILAYFIPGIIAIARHRRQAVFIFLVNLFFGWSVVGWIIALLWAFRADVAPNTDASPPPLPTTPSPA
jgi:hypothetical protein